MSEPTTTRILDNGATVTLSASTNDISRTLGQVRLVLLVASLAVLAIAAALLVPVVSRALRPLETMTATSRAIAAGDRGRRLNPDTPGTELGRAATAFDDMLDVVEHAEEQANAAEQRLRDFVSDAAHELRTPLTGVQAASEHMLRSNPDRVGRERLLVNIIREAHRASGLVEDMLTMARIDAGLREAGPVDSPRHCPSARRRLGLPAQHPRRPLQTHAPGRSRAVVTRSYDAVMSGKPRRARVKDVHELALGMPHVSVERGPSDNPVYQVGGKSFVFFRTPRPDATDPETGERYRDVIVFWVASESDKQALLQDQESPFFTTLHFDGHPSVLLRASRIRELSLSELTEVVQDAWLAQASNRRRTAWLSTHGVD